MFDPVFLAGFSPLGMSYSLSYRHFDYENFTFEFFFLCHPAYFRSELFKMQK